MFTLPFHVVGCSHESADPSIIGRLGVAESELTALLRDVFAAGIPCVLLSTCNRTELYWWGRADAAPIFRAWVAGRLGTIPPRIIERRDADLAVRHMFAVAAGLRSQRLGEPEILGQLRRAWTIAREAGVTVPSLDALFQRGIQAARRIRARAGDGVWGRSLGDAAASFVDEQLGDSWGSRRVLVIGSGAAAHSAVRAVKARAPREVVLSSRTDDHACEVAAALGVVHAAWCDVRPMLHDADVVIFATRSRLPVVSAEQARAIADARGDRRAIWLDLGVPPNVEPHAPVGSLSLFSLTDLPNDIDSDAHGAAVTDSALQGELARFASELHRRSLAERLPAMENVASEVARATVHRLRVSLGAGGMSDALTPELDAAAADVARRMTRLLLREMAAIGHRDRGLDAQTESASDERVLPISVARAG